MPACLARRLPFPHRPTEPTNVIPACLPSFPHLLVLQEAGSTQAPTSFMPALLAALLAAFLPPPTHRTHRPIGPTSSFSKKSSCSKTTLVSSTHSRSPPPPSPSPSPPVSCRGVLCWDVREGDDDAHAIDPVANQNSPNQLSEDKPIHYHPPFFPASTRCCSSRARRSCGECSVLRPCTEPRPKSSLR